jgi:LA2681-like HEPN
MTSQERRVKNAICDRLMQEGVGVRPDDEAIERTCLLTELAIELGRKDGVERALRWHEALDSRDIKGEKKIVLDLSRANAIAGKRYGTEWTWEQPTLAREIYYLRRALSRPEFAQATDVTRCKVLNNLGNRLTTSGRAVEALHYWRRVLEIQPNFGMSLCNRAKVLAEYGTTLQNANEGALFFWVAHKEASAALAQTAIYTDPRDLRNREIARRVKEWVESFMNLKGIEEFDPAKHFLGLDTSASKEERNYRYWCVSNYLFLNPANDVYPYVAAMFDSLSLPTHVIRVDSPHIFSSFFDQMTQEYVSARWSLYEALTRMEPHFSDRDVLLQASEPRAVFSLAVERLKTVYLTAYALFDKIGFFVNAYMELGISEKHVTFRTLWRLDGKGPIRNQFDSKDNWGFCALYWLAKDFIEKETDDVAEPQARQLSDIRNHIEHKYLRVTLNENPVSPPDDLALMVSRKQFEEKTIHLLKLARAALIYLSVGVGFEEIRRAPSLAGTNLEEIPPVPSVSDAEKN